MKPSPNTLPGVSLWHNFFVGCGILLHELTIHFLTPFHCCILFYTALLMQDNFSMTTHC